MSTSTRPRARLALAIAALALIGLSPAQSRAAIAEALDARIELTDLSAQWLGDSPEIRLLPLTLYDIHQLPQPALPLRALDVGLVQSGDGKAWVTIQSNLPAPADAMVLLVVIEGASENLIRRLEVDTGTVPNAPDAAPLPDTAAEWATADTSPAEAQVIDPQVWGWLATTGLLFTLFLSRRSARIHRPAGGVTSLTRRVINDLEISDRGRAPRAPARERSPEKMMARLAEIRAEREEALRANLDGIEVSFSDELPSEHHEHSPLFTSELMDTSGPQTDAAAPAATELFEVYGRAQQYLRPLEEIDGTSETRAQPMPNPLFAIEEDHAREHELGRLFASIRSFRDPLERLTLAMPNTSGPDSGTERDTQTNPVIHLTKAIREKLAEISLIVSQSGNAEHSHWLVNHLLKGGSDTDQAMPTSPPRARHRGEAE